MSQSFILSKQRGIYSEMVNPENTQIFGESFVADSEKSFILTQTKKQNIPKAQRLGSNNSLNASMSMGYKSKRNKLKTPQQALRVIKEQRGEEEKTIDPKVLEPYEPIPGRVPRKVAIDRKKKEYASYDLEELIAQYEDIDFNNKFPEMNWLPLELFDDTTYDDFSNGEWIKKKQDEDGNKRIISGNALYRTPQNEPIWRKVIIDQYDAKSDLFICRWRDNNEEIRLHRIYICLDAEDPRKYVLRVANAFQERIFADSIIKYNYYIDNMPKLDLAELDTEQQKRLINLTQTKKLQTDMTSLLQEVNDDYMRTMNKIIFDKFLEDSSPLDHHLYPQLNLPESHFIKKEEVREYGMMELERSKGAKLIYMYNPNHIYEEEPKDFTETFKDFCFESLYIKEEVITALQEIRVECNKVLEMSIFNLNIDQIESQGLVLDQFKHIQESAISQIMYHLKGQWINELIRIIKNNFDGVGKGWFNMRETSKITYDFGKLKRFLTVVRLMMQDTILSLVQRCYNELNDFIMSYVPNKVSINSPSEIHNDYGVDEKTYKPKQIPALFTIDLIKTPFDDKFLYNVLPQNFVLMLIQTMEKGLDEIAKIPDLEPKILQDLYKASKNETYIKAPMKPREKPMDPDPNERPKKYPDDNKWIWTMVENLREKLNIAIKPLEEYLGVFDEFKEVLLLNPDEYVTQLEMDEENPLEIEKIQELIQETQEKEKKLKKNIPEKLQVSFFNINTKGISDHLCDKYYTLSKNLTDLIAKKARQQTQIIFNQFQKIQGKIKELPSDIEALTEMKEFMDQIPQEMEKIRGEMNKCFEIYSILEGFNFRFSKDDMDKRWQIFGGPAEIDELIEKRVKELEKDKIKFQEEMKEEQDELRDRIENLDQTIISFHNFQNLTESEEVAQTAQDVNNCLQQFVQDSKKFNSREALFEDSDVTNYDKINHMQKEFAPYSNLWLTADKWTKYKASWLNDEFETVDAVAAEKFVEESSRILQGVIRYFRDQKKIPAILKIAQTIKEQIDEFKPKIPLLVSLRKPGMIDRHWKQVSEKLGKEVKPDENFTFQQALDLNLMNIVDDCVEIGERAYKEYQIETMLNEMQAKWETINFQIIGYKEQHHIIRGYDDIQIDLDEHIVNTQAMQFSPFKKPYEERIVDWNNTLKIISDVLEEWAKCQGQWMYLQPIFDSPDIAKQLPAETKKFKTVDSTWKYTMGTAKTLVNVQKVCTQEGLLERLQEANKNLEIIQKELNNYLEKKREKFARFYFLSNDDLLEILSQTKEPTAVQPHLKKVFENINEVEFKEDKKIKAMVSAEKEKVEFVSLVDPVKKNVEDWMGELEDMMMKSIRASLLKSVEDYQQQKRIDWVKLHPGQCVLNGSQIVWTNEVEEAIKGGVENVKEYHNKLNEQLNDLVILVRTPLKKQEKVTLNALIVIDVHAKDVVEKLHKENINNVQGFEWISQLRYYWTQDNCYVDCVQTHFPYGYEYLGNTLRLVITPLTDKCYMTLMGALKLNLGGAPAGPAGTGKTESTKDLAKALAKQCVVFNCSDSMDYIMVGKFFKGLASAGAWCCFDEFNRINIEVLSVIAQQLLVLFGEKAKGTPSIEFEGSVIKILPTFCVFITMNPGYAGRTELPDNLKALFRAVAMMVPDYAMIGEIMLYSFGFSQGRSLAKKMVATFKLSSEQLSSQDHYDYGMRAVRSVINAAGLLKAQEPDEDEEKLMLRGLKDVNVPKFLKDDIPLFENIILDLFPGVQQPKVNYGKLIDEINNKCAEFNLQTTKPFINKVFQLYDTIQVRHGLMMVGPTGGGKTKNLQVLSAAMTALKDEGQAKVITHLINPKSITMGQLYGQFNEQTHEWTDGVLAYRVRECCRDLSSNRHWVIFDGPVDSLWIESMNTVLDDNKKLCLNSGQILTLTPYMTMMFEVEDLFYASPATVSRCGMIYMEPGSLGYQCLIDSWFNSIPKNIYNFNKISNKLTKLFTDYLDDGLRFLRYNLIEPSPTSDNQLIQSLQRILDCFFVSYTETEIKKIPPEELQNLENMIEPLFLFSFIWSIGATTNSEGREKFDQWLRGFAKSKKCKIQWPDEGNVYDYEFSLDQGKYISWDNRNENFQINPNLGYHEITIPTTDSTRNLYISQMMMENGKHLLCPGPTGTGKTQSIMQLLTMELNENYQAINVCFSAQTSANQTQDQIDSKMDKRRKGIYGPPIGKKCIIFVDDMNMPKKEIYAAQPPLELIRQFLDHQGWYNRRDLQFMKLEDVIILGAMGPPGGGRTFISNRVLRHFNILGYTELSENTIRQIFNSLVVNFTKRYNESIKEIIPTIVDSVLNVYNEVNKDLLPTPSKSHYTFNLRDIWRVFQGLVSGNAKQINEPKQILKLFYHENMRVFHDRLTTEDDREYLKDLLIDQFSNFNLQKDDIIDIDRIIFGDFMQGRDAEPKIYQQITDLDSLLNQMDSFQEDYNGDSTFVFGGGKKPMKLIMFLDACEHIARIARIIRQPNGNALLLGVGGSGRQSLSRMATFLTNYKIFQIEVIKNYGTRAWRDDIKKALMYCGLENKPLAFLITDTQIIRESMMEDINSILNGGDVTGLYQEKDYEDIISGCKHECVKRGIAPTKQNIFVQYIARIKKNIHLITAMSPLGSAFTTRLRMFPSLVNNCTIDWFTEWPEEALIGVGKGQLMDYEEELEIQGKIPTMVEVFKNIHKSVEKESILFLDELRRYNYVTPTSYLELLSMFRTILLEKKKEIELSIKRLKSGLDKLNEANTQVEEMQVQLKDMEPQLQKASQETEVMMEHLSKEKTEAEATQKIVAKEEAEATKQEQEARRVGKEAEDAVADANKSLELTLLEVQKLKKEHLTEIKSLGSPPIGVKITLAGVVILLLDKIKKEKGGELIMTADPNKMGKKEENYFETAKRYLLNDTRELLELLMTYDRDNISQKTIDKLQQNVLNNENFSLAVVERCSFATKFLYMWVTAMVDYHKVFTETEPLREKLEEMKKLVSEKTAELKLKKDELQKVNDKIKALQDQFDTKLREKQELSDKIEECAIKLDRAQKLTNGLSEEKDRWGNDIKKLEEKAGLVPAHSIIAAGMISYSGPFTSHYRSKMEKLWVDNLQQVGLDHDSKITMRDFLGVPVKIQQWNIAGLPKDDTSTENGIIIDKSRRWPLMIDPQTQANKFIKNIGKEHSEGIEIMKINDPNLMKTMELSVQFGRMVLLENVGTDLDPSLESILQQQIVKQGSSLTIAIGDKNLNYNDKFRLYLTTTLPNPHYPPETFVKVAIINFAITPNGLEEQMLAQIVALENPSLEQRKTDIVKKNAQDQKQLLKIEDDILKSLSETGDIQSILKDESLINQLQTSKKFAAEINQRVKDSKIVEKQIDEGRESYRPVAYRASILFFCIVDLANIDPMYQYSLQWFTNLFSMGVENSTQSNVLEERLKNLNDYFTYSLYENICRSLFERHKLMFSFMLTIKILQGSQLIDEQEWRFLLTGPSGDVNLPSNPTSYIPDNNWSDVYRQLKGMDQIESLRGIEPYFMENSEEFKQIFDEPEAHLQPMPEYWDKKLNSFQKLIFLKMLRADKLIPAIQNYITEKIGEEFIVVPIFDLAKCYKDSSIITPLIFVLSAGSDPVSDFLKFADEMQMSKRIDSISLGQGQGAKAERIVRDCSQRGGWVLLQNCHLAQSWMNDLEKLCEELNENMHKDFRLWLTSMPSSYFPISVLQNSIKMTVEPPSGLRQNLLRTYKNISDEELVNCEKPDQFRKLLFGFALFHAIIQDRRKFGPIGWNIPYDFTNEDFDVCKKQLKMLLDEYSTIPYKAINFLGAQINYGGRVTDDKDVRLISVILKNYINNEALRDGYKYSESGIYQSIAAGTLDDYLDYINGLPLNPSPEAFGMHDNAEITNSQNQTRTLLENIVLCQPRASSGAGKSREETIDELATFIQEKTPPKYDIQEIQQKYPTSYEESLNTVLFQEVIRYNRLLVIMKDTLINLKKGLKGLVVLSEELEKLGNSLFDNQVPQIWAEKGFLSLKPLSSWIVDLQDRINFLNNWIENGTPKVFWFSGFFFPQAFITGVTQNYARKHVIAIDQLEFDYFIVDDKTHQDITQKPEDGCYIYGMYLEGSKWDTRKHCLSQPKPKELFSNVPLMQLVPVQNRQVPTEGIYLCPLYKTVDRRGTLSTTGHSTNFVMYIEFNSRENQDVWIKAGVASFLALRY